MKRQDTERGETNPKKLHAVLRDVRAEVEREAKEKDYQASQVEYRKSVKLAGQIRMVEIGLRAVTTFAVLGIWWSVAHG